MEWESRGPGTYTRKERNMFLTGVLGQNMIYNIVATGFTYYLQSVIFIPAIATGVIFSIARVWDALNDPIMGSIVDRTRSKWGKCRPYLLFAPPLLGLGTILAFLNGTYSAANPPAKNVWIIAWAAISYILWGMLYTVGDIPLWGITTLMTEKERDRSKLLALCRIFGAVGGGFVMVSIVPLSQAAGSALLSSGKIPDVVGSSKAGFILVAAVFSIAAAAAFQMAGLFARERVRQSDGRRTMKENFRMMWENRPFRQILAASVLRSPLQLLVIVSMPLISYYFGNNGQKNYMLYLLIFAGGMFGGQFLMNALTPKICEKYEKKKVYTVCAAAGSVPFGLLFAAYMIAPAQLDRPFWTAVLFVLFTLSGGGMGAVNVLQSIMIADAIDYEEYCHGIRPDGVFFSGQTFAIKLAAGISALLQGIIYSAAGFSGDAVRAVNEQLAAGASFKSDPQFEPYRLAMLFCCSVPPMLGLLLSTLPFRRYALTDSEHTRILGELNLRRHGADSPDTAPDAPQGA